MLCKWQKKYKYNGHENIKLLTVNCVLITYDWVIRFFTLPTVATSWGKTRSTIEPTGRKKQTIFIKSGQFGTILYPEETSLFTLYVVPLFASYPLCCVILVRLCNLRSSKVGMGVAY